MKYVTILLLLAGCASEPKQTVCMERIDMAGLLKYADVYEGKTTANCNQWCVGKDVGRRCGCLETCICKRTRTR